GKASAYGTGPEVSRTRVRRPVQLGSRRPVSPARLQTLKNLVSLPARDFDTTNKLVRFTGD
ncbi:MAG: hypothetical protein ACLP7Q_10610, partial [Isosphaeraceae bacterium]